jgi:UPF0716 protein FxsA
VPLVLLLLFIVVPAVEIYVIVQVGQLIGVLPTILLLLADAALGTWLFKREGRKAWQALREALVAHRVPAREVADGALVVLGGAFLITPGFVTDVIGVLCLLPPTRALLRRALTGVVGARLLGSAAPRGHSTSYPGQVIDGDVVDPAADEDRP